MPFGKDVIESILPHRDPFLLIDEVTELEPGRRVVARRSVNVEDWWFPGHFPDRPVMPEQLQIFGLRRQYCWAACSFGRWKNRSSPDQRPAAPIARITFGCPQRTAKP